MNQILAILAFVSFAYSQIVSQVQKDCNSVYPQCQTDANNFKTSACDPFLKTNATQFQVCLCFHQSQKLRCFAQCTLTQAVNDEKAAQNTVAFNACAPYGYNHIEPGRAPWVPADLAPSPTQAPISGSQTAPVSQTKPTQAVAKSDASQFIQYSLVMLAAAVFPALL